MPQQCIDKDIKIRPAQGRVHVIFDQAEIVSSTRALELDEPGSPLRIYVPLEDVQPGILEMTETHTTCPHKGEASYYTIKTLTATAEDAAWYYPDPCPQVAEIRDMVAFWGDRIEYRTTAV